MSAPRSLGRMDRLEGKLKEDISISTDADISISMLHTNYLMSLDVCCVGG